MQFIERMIVGFIDLEHHPRKQGMGLHVFDIRLDIFGQARDRAIDTF
jgi:hypothetical protein